MRPATRIAIVLLALIAVGHLLRILLHVGIVVAGRYVVPMWVSAVACLVTGALAGWMWREARS
jgi:hypothetical protein